MIIVSFIKGDTANKIIEMQDKLIKQGVDESLKVKEDKIHITHIALYTTKNLERFFTPQLSGLQIMGLTLN